MRSGRTVLLACVLLAVASVADSGQYMQGVVGAGGSVRVPVSAHVVRTHRRNMRVDLFRVESAHGPVRHQRRFRRRAEQRGPRVLRFPVGRLGAGVYRVVDRWNYKGRARRLGYLEVRGPKLAEPSPTPVGRGAWMQVYGSYFGPDLVTARLGGRRMRVRTWRSGETTHVRIPRGIPDGDYPLTIETPAGKATTLSPVRVRTKLYRTSQNGMRPTGAFGFETEHTVIPWEARIETLAPGRMQLAMVGMPNGVLKSAERSGVYDHGSTHVAFAMPDIFGAGQEFPLTLPADWAVVHYRADTDPPGARPSYWYRRSGLAVTVRAFDEETQYAIVDFSGSLTRVDSSGEPLGGPDLQIRDGRIEGTLIRHDDHVVESAFPLRLGPPSSLDTELSDAVIGRSSEPHNPYYPYGRVWVQHASAQAAESRATTRFLDAGGDDAVFTAHQLGSWDSDLGDGAAFLIEAQGAPPTAPGLPLLTPRVDESAIGAWVPLCARDHQGDPGRAFADLGVEWDDGEPDHTFSAEPLNHRGYRLVRFRITFRMTPTEDPDAALPRVYSFGLSFTRTGTRPAYYLPR